MKRTARIAGISRRTLLVVGLALTLVGGAVGVSATVDPAVDRGEPAASTFEPVVSPAAAASEDPTPLPVSDAAGEATSLVGPGGGGGGNNIVTVNNRRDNDLVIRSSIKLNRINAPNARPLNLARAFASCTDCQTIAVAMQVNLVKRGAHHVAPQNGAVAINYECTRCTTAALALQYTYTVDDPRQTTRSVDRLIREMDKELRAISRDRSISLEEAVMRIDAVLGRFQELAASLDDRRSYSTDDTSPGAADEPEARGEPYDPAGDGTGGPESDGSSPVPAETPAPTVAGATTDPGAQPASPAPSVTPEPSDGPTPSPTPVEANPSAEPDG